MKTVRFLVLALLVFSTYYSQAQVAGPNSPSGASVTGNGVYFASYTTGFNALDNNMAYAVLGAYPLCASQIDYQCYYSELATITNFGFAIPSNAVIDGIAVEVSKKVSQPVSDIRDSVVQLVRAGTPAGSNYASALQWPMAFTYSSYGGAADLWNTTWTPADINAPSFGIQLQLTNGAFDQTAQVDHVRITVYYTTPAGLDELQSIVFQPAVVAFSLVFSNPNNSPGGRLVILDQLSRKVAEVEKFSYQPVDISGLKKGIYFIRLETTKGTITRKIIF